MKKLLLLFLFFGFCTKTIAEPSKKEHLVQALKHGIKSATSLWITFILINSGQGMKMSGDYLHFAQVENLEFYEESSKYFLSYRHLLFFPDNLPASLYVSGRFTQMMSLIPGIYGLYHFYKAIENGWKAYR